MKEGIFQCEGFNYLIVKANLTLCINPRNYHLQVLSKYTQLSVLLVWNQSISETIFLGNLVRMCQASLIITPVSHSLFKLGRLGLFCR